LEKIHAEHTAATTMVGSNRARLTLLGMTDGQLSPDTPFTEVTATAMIAAPIDGTITTRDANVGLTVDPATPLFTVVDLSTLWVVGDLYEQDFARVRVGSPAIVTTTAYPDLSISGQVSYIDPQVKPDTRTAQVRVEVQNPRRQLRLGMYAEIRVSGLAAGETPLVPRSAVQTVGDRALVYMADAQRAGHFVEREVRLGDVSGEQVAITRGLQAGDVVVMKGSFSLRAERERLGLRLPPTDSQAPPTGRRPSAASPDGPASTVQTATVIVSEQGYEPSRVVLHAGRLARLTFTRTTEKTCGTEIMIPSLNIKRALPLNQPVGVEFTPERTGDIAFACGMNMLRGTIVVQ
jgi:hypothetical protein